MRNETIEKLIVTEEASFQDTIIKDVATGVADTDAVNKKQLDDASFAGGYNAFAWDDTTGNMTASTEAVAVPVVNLDGRYPTTAETEALIAASSQNIFTIVLPSATSVADRVAGATEVPSGWSLGASGLDLFVTHNLGRPTADTTVFASVTSTKRQKLFNTAAYSGLFDYDDDMIQISSLATIQKEIHIHIILA